MSNFNGRGRVGQVHCLWTYRQRFFAPTPLHTPLHTLEKQLGVQPVHEDDETHHWRLLAMVESEPRLRAVATPGENKET
jgi:hypothetical protein